MRGLAIGLAAALLLGLGALWHFHGAPPPTASALPSLSIGGPFTLTDDHGQSVHDTSYPGRYLLVTFGYTTCPDICPTTLQTIASALDLLGPRADRVAPLFVTVDPVRDTPDVLRRYVALFSPRLVGLTGTPAEVAQAERAYRVYAARVDQPGTTSYLMDHTSFIYFLSPHGQLIAIFDHQLTAFNIADAMRTKLD